MKRPLTKKVIVTSFIALILLIPLMMIQGKISERERYQQDARHSISQSWTGKQTVVGPVVVVPYQIQWTEEIHNKKDDTVKTKTHRRNKFDYIIPTSLGANFKVKSSKRYKGIFQVPVYESDLTWQGKISKATLSTRINAIKNRKYFHKLNTPFMILSVSDARGFSTVPTLQDENTSHSFLPGTKGYITNTGAHLPLASLIDYSEKDYEFNLNFQLRGMETISILPIAEDAKVSMIADWPHPSFGGDQLPQHRSIYEKGFEAHWQTSSFSNPFIEKIKSCDEKHCGDVERHSFSVDLVEPVDIYLQSERSVKYGFLFIALSFLAFFIFEVLQRHPIHPIQYTLIGLSLAVFYLLLVSLSEHVAFGLAYGIAATACISLLTTYLRFVLNGLQNSVIFTVSLACLYGVLYVVIQAEDFALLMGTTVVFAALGCVMWVTRKVDWYQIEQQVIQQSKRKDTPASKNSGPIPPELAQ